MPQIETGEAGDRWVNDQFVCALRDVDIVRQVLQGLQVPPGQVLEVDRCSDLDLALMQIADVDAVAATVQVDNANLLDVNESERSIERVLRAVRNKSRDDFGKWEPVIGKNRVGDGVHGAPDIGIGGVRVPDLAVQPADVPEADSSGRWIDVGLLDTGIVDHKAFANRWVPVADDPRIEPADEHWYVAGHGTFVAGLILRYAPNARLHVRKALDDVDGAATVWEVAKAVVSFSRTVRVLNLSFCCFTQDGLPPLALSRAIERLDHDMIVVAAAGNHADADQSVRNAPHPKSPSWPAAFDRVIAAGSHHEETGEPSPFSPPAPWVKLSAPGEAVTSTYLTGKVRLRPDDEATEDEPATRDFDGSATWSGTSFAAGVLSGLVAQRLLEVRTLTEKSMQEVVKFPPGSKPGLVLD